MAEEPSRLPPVHCPYCEYVFVEPPLRDRHCPHCDRYIIVRRTGDIVWLLTEKHGRDWDNEHDQRQ